MKVGRTVGALVARIRVAASSVPAEPRAGPRAACVPVGHRAPPPAPKPVLAAEPSRFLQIEHTVLACFRPQMHDAVEAALGAAATAVEATPPLCCGRPMWRHDRRRVGWLT